MYATSIAKKVPNNSVQTSAREQHAAHSPVVNQRAEATAQLKLQELADNSPQVNNLPNIQQPTMPVAQLAKSDTKKVKKNHYHEKYNKSGKITKSKPTKWDVLKITESEYNKLTSKSRSTEEEGYTEIDLDMDKPTDWSLNDRVVEVNGSSIEKKGSFKLPVSCIESAEHVVHYSKGNKKIPDWKKGQKKSVDLKLNKTSTGKNEKALNISTDELLDTALQPYSSFDFSTDDINVNEGLLVIDPKRPSTTLHAVVVVGKNKKTKQIVVLERNAGSTSGDTTYYLDENWLLNIYSSPSDFLSSMKNPDLVVGKLVAS